MKCSHCGAKLRKKDLFCSRCGMPVRDPLAYGEGDGRTADRRGAYRDGFLERHEEGSRAMMFTVTVLIIIVLTVAVIILSYLALQRRFRLPARENSAAETETEDTLVALLRREAGLEEESPEAENAGQAENEAGKDQSLDTRKEAPGAEETLSETQVKPEETEKETETELPTEKESARAQAKLDMDEIQELMALRSGAQQWAVYVYDLESHQEYAAGMAAEPMFSSATISVPILYTAASLLDGGEITLNDQILYVNSIGGRGEPNPEQKDGKMFPLSYYLTAMLNYGDNNCMNCLIDYLTLDRINAVCRAAGFSAVDLQRRIVADVTDGTENYVSARDLAQMVKELYNGKFRTIGRDFMLRYFRIDGYGDGNTVLGRSASLISRVSDPASGLIFLNQNGMGDSRYSETAVISDEGCSYVISIMMSGESGFVYEEAAQAVSDVIYQRLRDNA